MSLLDIGKKMGLVKDDETQTVTKTAPKKQPASTPSSITSSPSPSSTVQQFTNTPYVAPVVDNSEFVEYLEKVFTERNFPGPDYYEFVEGLKKLQSAAMDERIKFISLFAGLSAAGLTKERLLEAAQKYIVIVQEEQKSFKAEVQSSLDNEVAGKEKNLKALNDENINIDAQIAQLNERKNKNYTDINALSLEINNDRQTLGIKEASFDSAVQIFINNINQNIQKINMYI